MANLTWTDYTLALVLYVQTNVMPCVHTHRNLPLQPERERGGGDGIKQIFIIVQQVSFICLFLVIVYCYG